MSLSSQSAYVDALDYDTLLHVFMMNADMFLDDEALVTTCRTSLVCRRWRNWMLETPSLWAKLIDMGWISCAMEYEFRDELLRRSGTAPLWIKSTWLVKTRPANHPKNYANSLFDVLKKNWHRTQKLVISCNIHPTFHPSSWPIFFRAAPELETFEVSLARHYLQPAQNPDDSPISTFFSGYAPLLHRFNLTCFTIDHRSPWLRHLQSISFDNVYSVHLVLRILSSTHQLQQLRVSYPVHEDLPSFLPIASLPHLKRLNYRGACEEGAILLNHIKIPLDCWLCMDEPWGVTLQPFGIPTTDENFISIVTTYIRHAQHYFQSHKVTFVSLNFEQPKFIYVEVKATCSTDVPLNLPIPLCKDRAPSIPAIILKKLEDLAIPDFSYTPELKFISNGPLDSSFWSIFSCFTSVRTFHSDCKTLGYLAELENSNTAMERSSLFPMLEVINLSVRAHTGGDTFKVDEMAAGFILSRMRNGRPITTLQLKVEQSKWCPIPDLEALSDADGLKVLYTCRILSFGGMWHYRETYVDLEYVCGHVNRENTSG